MKKLLQLTIAIAITIVFVACGTKSKKETKKVEKPEQASAMPERPSDAELHAYKAYHHARYMVQTVEQVGGTNKLLHTKELPTEGTDPVVSPALDHLYSKAVIDLTEGPATVEFPDDIDDRYWSIHVTDQEHYTIFDELRPIGKYTFVRKGIDMEVKDGVTVIECPEDYPHLFVRIQVKTPEDRANSLAIQEKIILTGESKPLEIENYIKFTLETHDVYPENKGILESVVDFNDQDYNRVTQYLLSIANKFPDTQGMFGPIDSEEPNSNNPECRAAAIFGHLGLPAKHAVYIPNFVNCDGIPLNGDNSEVFTFAYNPHKVEEFWSITRYSVLTRNTIAGKQDVFNSYNTQADEKGNITITFSINDPGDGTYWMPVNAGEPYYFIIRYYKADLNDMPASHCD